MFITIKYSCKGCGLMDRDVIVHAREPGSDVRVWMRDIQDLIGCDHRRVSRKCHSQTCDLKIPLSDNPNAGVGEK